MKARLAVNHDFARRAAPPPDGRGDMAEKTINEVPRKTRELFEKATSAFERGNVNYAIDMLSSIVTAIPEFLQARKVLRAAELKKFRDAGGGELTHLLSSLRGMFTLMSAQGALKKNPLDALQGAEKLLRLDPLNPSFAQFAAKAAVAAGLPEVAIHALEMLRDVKPRDVALLNELGHLYMTNNQMKDARVCFETVVQLRPNDPAALKTLKDAQAMDTMQKGRWTDGGDYRSKIKNVDEARVLEQQSKAVMTDGDVSSLIAETKAKLEREPQNINFRRALADLYQRANRYEEAIEVLQTAQESMGGGDPQIDRAISQLRVKAYQHDIAARRAAGDAAGAEEKERELDAFRLRDAEERVKRYPNDLQFKYDYGVLLFDHELYNDAVQQFQLSQRNPQRRIRSLYYLACCFKAKQQYDIAAEQLEKAASELNVMDDTKKDILYELGVVSDLMGQKEKATAYFKEIYSVDISYKDIAQRIEQAYRPAGS